MARESSRPSVYLQNGVYMNHMIIPPKNVKARGNVYKCTCGEEFSSYNKWARHKSDAKRVAKYAKTLR